MIRYLVESLHQHPKIEHVKTLTEQPEGKENYCPTSTAIQIAAGYRICSEEIANLRNAAAQAVNR
jgi:hypothetical protein